MSAVTFVWLVVFLFCNIWMCLVRSFISEWIIGVNQKTTYTNHNVLNFNKVI